jgi:N-methylhydantoinase B/oxoprolinase/acetone carboxylase alpha subunit
MAPGGWAGSAQDVVQEGLLLPAVQLYRGGELERDIKEVVLRNVRMPRQCWGDLQAQIASNIAAERRIGALVDKHGFDGLEAAIEAALDYGRRRFLAALENLPNGVGRGADVIEDDARGGGPYEISVVLEKSPAGVVADFSSSHRQVDAPVNCTFACLRAAVIGSLAAMIDPDIPLNAGVTELIDVRAPLGCIVNPTYPAPVFSTTADPADRSMETVVRAIGDLAPELIPAGSYSTGQNVTGGGVNASGQEFLWYGYQAGGTGAWAGGDGNNGEWHLLANSKNESMEVWETRYPVEHLAFELVADSAGAGRWRGGLAVERRWRLLADTRLTACSDHHRIGARGLLGGAPGEPNGFALVRDGERRPVQDWYGLPSPSKFANLPVPAGDVFVSRQGGGGGYGDPRERLREAVAADVRAGYVSPRAAREVYGWDGGTLSRRG